MAVLTTIVVPTFPPGDDVRIVEGHAVVEQIVDGRRVAIANGINLLPYTCTACGYERFRDRGARNESVESCIDDAKNALLSAQVWLDVALQWTWKKPRPPSAVKRRSLLAIKRALGRVQEKLDAQ